MSDERRCEACGKSIAHKRTGATCCDAKCRAALSRRRRAAADSSTNGKPAPGLRLVLAVGPQFTRDRPACGDRHRTSPWWRSTGGVLVCGLCHPPAVSHLVSRWELAA